MSKKESKTSFIIPYLKVVMGQFLILLITTLATLIPISSVAVGIALKVYQKEPVVKLDCVILAKIKEFLTKISNEGS